MLVKVFKEMHTHSCLIEFVYLYPDSFSININSNSIASEAKDEAHFPSVMAMEMSLYYFDI